jgi:hypothetical protein
MGGAQGHGVRNPHPGVVDESRRTSAMSWVAHATRVAEVPMGTPGRDPRRSPRETRPRPSSAMSCRARAATLYRATVRESDIGSP